MTTMRRRLLAVFLLVAVALTPPAAAPPPAEAAYTMVIDRYTWWDAGKPVAYGIRIFSPYPPYHPYYANAASVRDAELLVAGAELVATALSIQHVVRGTYP